MASLSWGLLTHRSVDIYVDNLQYSLYEYDKFTCRIEQNETQIFQDTISFSIDDKGGDSDNFTLYLENPDYLGDNTLSPNCTYVVYMDCYHNGQCYTLNSVEFTTPAINPPSVDDIHPSKYAAVRDQEDYETCVADSLACAMDIFKLNETDVEYENFSTAYIYGSDENDDEGMIFEDAVDLCIDNGSPRWEIHSGTFPDVMWKDEAVYLYKNANDVVIENAKKQRFKKKVNMDFYDCDSVADAIDETGYFMFNFRVPNNFYGIDEGGEVGSDGIIPQPAGGYSGKNHSMALIGLTTINGKRYWEAQNSWGEDWGNGGRCFIPYDWGCGVQSPIDNKRNNGPTSWTYDCYAVYPGTGYASDNPSETEISECALDENENYLVNMSWDNAGIDVEYIILARQKGTERWWVKPIDGDITTTDLSATVEVDSYGTYEFMIIAIKNGYCSRQSNKITLKVVDIFKPAEWEWTSDMSGQIDVIMSPRFNCPVVHPVTAEEWNAFLDHINIVREYVGLEHAGISYASSESEVEDIEGALLTPEYYNEIVDLLLEFGFTSNDLPYIDENTYLSADLFLRLRDVLNAAI